MKVGVELVDQLWSQESLTAFLKASPVDLLQVTIPGGVRRHDLLELISSTHNLPPLGFHSTLFSPFLPGPLRSKRLEEAMLLKDFNPRFVIEHFASPVCPLSHQKSAVNNPMSHSHQVHTTNERVTDYIYDLKSALGCDLHFENVALTGQDTVAYHSSLAEITRSTETGLALDLPHFFLCLLDEYRTAANRDNFVHSSRLVELVRQTRPTIFHLAGISKRDGKIVDNHFKFSNELLELIPLLTSDPDPLVILEATPDCSVSWLSKQLDEIRNWKPHRYSISKYLLEHSEAPVQSASEVDEDLRSRATRALSSEMSTSCLLSPPDETSPTHTLASFNWCYPGIFPLDSINEFISCQDDTRQSLRTILRFLRSYLSHLSWIIPERINVGLRISGPGQPEHQLFLNERLEPLQVEPNEQQVLSSMFNTKFCTRGGSEIHIYAVSPHPERRVKL